ncbi:MAG: dTDP-4-dehydrorhamnose 3,5-epimerase [Alphaproteobacteria bacterium]|nr:MAG: dTDP-4-dehydrorhamnose 3,5-epimerase [Alphaproteobacteria bacterium]
MTVTRLAIPDVWTYTPRRFADDRGWFSETFNAAALEEALGGVIFVQDNQSLSRFKGTMRGMHFQTPPKAQDKLLRVLRGSVLDVAVDLRRASPTYGQWVSALLSAENGAQIFVPKGFAHGFLTLEPDTEVLYKVSDFYSREHERGLVWNDPAIGIDWDPVAESVTIVDRDRDFPRLAALENYF